MNIMGIDPSIRCLGWALIHARSVSPKLYRCGVITTKPLHDEHWTSQSDRAVLALSHVVETLEKSSGQGIDAIAVEVPHAWDTKRGRAAINSGALMKLTFTTGSICYMVSRSHSKLYAVHPHQWKGNVPKEEMYERLCRRMGVVREIEPTNKNLNMIDAIGIALWALKPSK